MIVPDKQSLLKICGMNLDVLYRYEAMMSVTKVLLAVHISTAAVILQGK